PARRPVTACRVPAPYQPVGGGVMPAVLDHPPELLRPEVGHRVVQFAAAQDVRRHHLRGVDGGIPVLDPEPSTEAAGPGPRAAPPRREPPGPRAAAPRAAAP